MILLKFETYRKLKNFSKQIRWKVLFKIIVIPIGVLLVANIFDTNPDKVSWVFLVFLGLVMGGVLILNAFAQFLFYYKHKTKLLSDKEKRKLKLEKLQYESRRNLQRIKLRLF